jgi:carbon-monoxide dehydrogenase medium subunit
MIPPAFDYVAPSGLDDVIGLLQQHGTAAKLLAGGQSLLPLLKFRLAQPSLLVDINRIPGLVFIEEADGGVRIGAMTREADLENSSLLAQRYPILADTARVIADPLVRNLATVGGNLAHGDPANDHPATMLALRVSLATAGPAGTRVVPIDDFFVDSYQTTLDPQEILTEIRIPNQPPRSGGAYQKLERKVGDFAIAGVATQVTLDIAGTLEQVGIGLTNAGPTPIRASQAEEFLVGRRPDEADLLHAAQLAAAQAMPVADSRGSVEYKRAMVRTLTVRALRNAVERARTT